MADDSVIKLEKTILKIEAARSAENAKAKKETDAHRVELEKLAAKRNELGQFQSKEQRTNAQNEIDQRPSWLCGPTRTGLRRRRALGGAQTVPLGNYLEPKFSARSRLGSKTRSASLQNL